MVVETKPFVALTANDLMTRDVVVIPQEMSLPNAARLLLRERISGAPVVDGAGRCVGVLSATDFVHWAENNKRAAKEAAPPPACFCSEWQVSDVKVLPEGAVATYMTPDPVLVGRTTSIGELARAMLDAHIHRLIVTDAQKRPVGVVSSTDILAAVARAQPAEL